MFAFQKVPQLVGNDEDLKHKIIFFKETLEELEKNITKISFIFIRVSQTFCNIFET